MAAQSPSVFQFQQAHQVRAMLIDDEPWFVANDVCAVLDYTNPRMAISKLDDDEKGVSSIDTLGGPQEMAIINQSGLYALILTSRKPQARKFRKWITSEVLPALQKEGVYRMKGKAESAAGASISQQLAAHPVRLRLLNELEREIHPEKREAIHQQLAHVSGLLGLPVPEKDKIGRDIIPEPEPDVIAQFWSLFYHLGGAAVLNHSADPKLIAINLNHFAEVAAENGVEIPTMEIYRRSLRGSQNPRFIGTKPIHSVLNHHHNEEAPTADRRPKTVRCWVFQRPGASLHVVKED